MASVFEQRAAAQPNIVDKTSPKKLGSPFQQRAAEKIESESFGKSSLRTALQVPQGIAEATTYGLTTGLGSILGYEALDPEEIDRIRQISEREGVPFDEQSYRQSFQEAQSLIPTVSNIGSEIESRTGLPLEPKSRLDKAVRFFSSATKIAPGKSPEAASGYTLRPLNTGLQKPVLGAGITAAKEGLQEAGVPEPIAELGSFALLKKTPQGRGSFAIGPKTKPSGMKELIYEGIKKPREISESKIAKIQEIQKKDFLKIANDIVSDSPVGKTAKALREDLSYKKNTADRFNKLEEFAETIPEKINTKNLKTDLESNLIGKNTGITPSEFEKSRSKFIKEIVKETADKEVGFSELLKQYRKNNSELSQIFEPGQSYAHNAAKREALIDYNKAIADTFEKTAPKSGFAEPFKELNKEWTYISDVELIDKFLTDMTTGKIDYKKGREFFNKQGMTVPFERSLGKEGFAKFETLMKDLMSTEEASKLLKQAKEQGYGDLAKTAGSYLLHPDVAKAKLGLDFIKGGYNTIFEMVLDKPKIAITWDRGINALKKGDFKVAQKEFFLVDKAAKEIDAREISRREQIKKFNQKKSQ